LGWGNLTGYNLDVDWTGSLGWGNISNAKIYNASYDAQLGHNTTDEIHTAVANGTFMRNTYNASYDVQLGHNTTSEIQAVVNTTEYGTFNITTGGILYAINGTICGTLDCTVNITI